MATKKTNSPSKTKTAKKSTKKTTTKNARTYKPIERTAKPKTVKATEPYHPAFGVVLLLVCVIMAAVLLLGASKAFISATLSDAKIFSSSYTEVGTDNVYKIKTAEETIEMLQKGTGVIFIGFPSCPWCQAYAPMLNDLAREHGITEISYFDIKEDRANDTDNYKDIVSLLSSYLQSDENNNKRVYVPETAFVINGTIIGNDYETSKETLGISDPKEYWTEERVSAWKEQVGKLMDSVKAAEGCTTTCDE